MVYTVAVKNCVAQSFGVELYSKELEGALLAIAGQLNRMGKGPAGERDGAILQLADALDRAGDKISDALYEVALAIRAKKGGECDKA